MGPNPSRPTLSEAEQEVLETLWREGPGTVRQVNARLNETGRRWAYTTVLTLLQRLQAKGWVSSDTAGHAHVFRARASRDELLRDHLQTLADRFCEGAPAPLVLALVQGKKLSADDIARFRKMLDELDANADERES